ncbi:ribosomal protein RPL18A [Cardiosporidium cionae]|uniref:60S ribosomal protein L18a n=1 Tax=Cardiosporidium cionae TaxID=476202 RepID=A0ABQ7J8D6_9APIC|nr:ribosomal protein RPL18A [Cardiosporidium cionae]|eukprot:KAF8820199.1 ribosomal protein RPL18A [Cardiosporidium cionae]
MLLSHDENAFDDYFQLHLYEVVGRAIPTATVSDPKIYKMKIFAKNKVMARSKYWSFLSKMKKTKRSKGEVLGCSEVFEKSPLRVKTYGAYLRYQSRTGSHSMYKEYRDLAISGAVSQLYSEMAGRHRALPSAITIYRIQEIKNKEVRRPKVSQLLKGKLKWPSIRRLPLAPRRLKSTFCAKRPTTFFH